MKILTFDKAGAEAVEGRYGTYSALKPVPTPDGQYMLPERVLVDADLVDSVPLVETNTTGENDILPLPAFGEVCTVDVLYISDQNTIEDDGSNVVKCVQTHNRTEHDPKTIPALFTFFRTNADDLEWIENEYVYVDWMRVFEGNTYVVLQEHMTLSTWTPPAVPALWGLVVEPSGDWTVGVAYAVDDEVNYSGTMYRCLQAHTAQVGWEPPNVGALWTAI